MFIATEIVACFFDTIDAQVWQVDITFWDRALYQWHDQFDSQTPRPA